HGLSDVAFDLAQRGMRARPRASWGLTERTEKMVLASDRRRQCVIIVGASARRGREPAAVARSEQSLAGRVGASMGASRQVRGRRPVVPATFGAALAIILHLMPPPAPNRSEKRIPPRRSSDRPSG